MRTLFLVTFSFALTAAAVFVAADAAWNIFDGREVKKTVKFNHNKHVGLQELSNCEFCHSYNEHGRFAGLPAVKTCLTCHNKDYDLFLQSAGFVETNKVLAAYKADDKPWQSYAKQEKNIFFSHKIIMTSTFKNSGAKQSCSFNVCHGKMASAPDSYAGSINLEMNDCLDCHTALNISRRCMVCH